MRNSNKWLSSKWAVFVGIGIALVILIVIPFLFSGGRLVGSIIGEVAIVIVIVLALAVFITRVFRK